MADPRMTAADTAAAEASRRHGKPILVASDLVYTDRAYGNPGPLTVKQGGRLCYPSAHRSVAALRALVDYAEFRASGGKAAQFGDNPLVILHTIGAKSGELREIPLVTLVEGDDLYVFASKGGAPTNPDWYYNLKANPDVTITADGITRGYRAREVSPDEKSALWPVIVDAYTT